MTQSASSLDDAIAVIKLHMRCFFVRAEMHFWRSPPVTQKASVTLHMYLPTVHARGGIESNQCFRCQMGGNANAGYISPAPHRRIETDPS